MWKNNWLANLQEEARLRRERQERQKREGLLDEREHRREERETHTLRINIGLAVFAGLAALAALWQGYESHRATKEAQKNFETTREDAKQSAAQARQDALATINKQLDAQRELRDQAARSANAAESTAAISAQSFHVSERAYVSLTPLLGRPLETGKQTILSLLIENNGRTPALGLTATVCITSAPPNTPIQDVHALTLSGKVQKFSSSAVSLPPGKHFEQHPTTQNFLSQTEFDDLSNGNKVFYLFATASYEDIFGKTHHEEICGYLDRNLRQLDTCRELNKSE